MFLYFFGSKISGLCIFLGLQYEAPSDPPLSCTLRVPPLGMYNCLDVDCGKVLLSSGNITCACQVLKWGGGEGQLGSARHECGKRGRERERVWIS